MTAIRAAIHARVCSGRQATGSTIGSQTAALQARLARDGRSLTPDERFCDEGHNRATLVRPAPERLRGAAAAGHLDRMDVHSPGRLARRHACQVPLIGEFRRAGVEMVCLNRSIGVSPEDELLLPVQGMVAAYARAKILERSRRGKRHAAHQGAVSVLSGVPQGTAMPASTQAGGVARHEVQQDEARIVRQIFQWIGRERISIGEVCRRRRTRGGPARSGQPAWDRSTGAGILKNPAYAGVAAFGKTRVGPLPACLRRVRGGAGQPCRAYGVDSAAPQAWISVPVPPGSTRRRPRRRSGNWRRTASVAGRAPAASALCGNGWWSAGSAVMHTMARPSAWPRPKASGAIMPAIVVAAVMRIVSAAGVCARTSRCAPAGWTKRCGEKLSGCLKTPVGSRPSTSGASAWAG
jgi:site-specific DNA recombinase